MNVLSKFTNDVTMIHRKDGKIFANKKQILYCTRFSGKEEYYCLYPDIYLPDADHIRFIIDGDVYEPGLIEEEFKIKSLIKSDL